jgi:hypothetical protein
MLAQTATSAAVLADTPHQSTQRGLFEFLSPRSADQHPFDSLDRNLNPSDGVPGLRLTSDCHVLQAPGKRQLLAMLRLRRYLECRAVGESVAGRLAVALTNRELIRELEELITALDRRVPRVEQAGEASIAHDAAALRAKAVARLQELAGPARTVEHKR